MNFFSAKQDFEERTLKKIGGRLRVLRFCALQRTGERDYEHWGLAREYGAEAASAALREVHCEVFTGVLRAPMQELAGELRDGPEEGISAKEWREVFAANEGALVPAGTHRESARHFDYIAFVLRSIAASSNRLAARRSGSSTRN